VSEVPPPPPQPIRNKHANKPVVRIVTPFIGREPIKGRGGVENIIEHAFCSVLTPSDAGVRQDT